MSDGEDVAKEEFKFFADRAKTGRATCKKCKQKIETGTLRMAKTGTNPYGSGIMKMWHHVPCMFEVFAKQRKTTAKIECLDDIGGWDSLKKEDQDEILSHLPESARVRSLKPKLEETKNEGEEEGACSSQAVADPPLSKGQIDVSHKDNSFREFRRLCCEIANVSAYTEKTAIMNRFFTKGSDGSGFKGDLLLTVKLLLPGVIKRIYNIQSKQIVKLFSRIFRADLDAMLENLDEGDVGETIQTFFESSKAVKPSAHSKLTLQEVDLFLEHLSKLTREEDQTSHFSTIIPKCTSNDLKMIIRLVKHDLRMFAGAKHVLDAVHPDAYEAFQASRDIDAVITQVTAPKTVKKQLKHNALDISIKVLTPLLPMLAAPCKSAVEAIKKCPNGMYADIKYDGERVQLHKQGNVFKYFSRSLKPVLPHKVKMLDEFIPQAFPFGEDLILDGEILLIDTTTSKPLPFGTLGKHKKNEFKDATVCLFVFDCIYYNGEYLACRPLKERRKILLKNMKEIPHRVVFSEVEEITKKEDLEILMVKVFKEGLEGLVLKDVMSFYEPGKRHWLKIKKDYLFGGSMADAADLVVLGAWYGTGQKGGMMSVFLMGCYDDVNNHWCTVTKVHTGLDDATLNSLQSELKMVKIGKDVNKVPSWLRCTKTMVPDFVSKNPEDSPVWQISGAEFTKHVVHTAEGISIRFPRVARIRPDKDWETATNLTELKELYRVSKETTNFSLPSVGSVIEMNMPRMFRPSPTKIKKPTATSPVNPVGGESLVSEEASGPSNNYAVKKPLPNVFKGMKLALPRTNMFISPHALNVIPRFFVAYGGEIVGLEDVTSDCYVLTDKHLQYSGEGIPVSSSWLLLSISWKRLQPLPDETVVYVQTKGPSKLTLKSNL